jgi:hypothetical protein
MQMKFIKSVLGILKEEKKEAGGFRIKAKET